MGWLAAALLAAAVAGALSGRADLVRGGVPLAAAAVGLTFGAVDGSGAADALGHLVEPLAFVAIAVLLADALADAGVFAAFARWVPRTERHGGLWLLAAATVVVLNLDAAVVLLTPLYASIAREGGEDPLPLAAQPALLACLASSVLPVSNLTNLIAVDAGRADLGLFVRLLWAPTAVAVAVGYAGWRLRFRSAPAGRAAVGDGDGDGDVDPGALRLGAAVVVALVAGFVGLGPLGVPHWAVAAAVLVAVSARRRGRPDWRRLPLAVVAATCGLAVLAAGVAAAVDVGRWLGTGSGAGGELRLVAVAAAAANVVNNLPAFLVALPAVHGDRAVAALLLGANAGPVLLVTGTLSGLLWLDTARRAGLDVGARTYASIGASAVPAVVAAAATFVLLR